jgi:hypothetical protein
VAEIKNPKEGDRFVDRPLCYSLTKEFFRVLLWGEWTQPISEQIIHIIRGHLCIIKLDICNHSLEWPAFGFGLIVGGHITNYQ